MGQNIGKRPLDKDLHILASVDFLKHFKDPQSYIDIHNVFPQFPKVQFLKFIHDDQYIILNTVLDGPTQSINAILDEWKEKKSHYNHPNLLVLHKLYVDEYTKYIFPYIRITLYFDYPKQSLAEHYKIASKQGLNQKEIWFLLDCVTSALAFLQSKEGYCGNIGLNQIYQVQTPSGDTVFKVVDRFFKPVPQPVYAQFYAQINDTKKLYQLSNQIFLSQAQLDSLCLKRKYPVHDVFKSDVFALGLTCLYCIDLQDSKNVYDFNKLFVINEENLKQRLDKLKSQQISLDLINCLKWMLEIMEEQRPDFLELDEHLDQVGKLLNWKRYKDTITMDDIVFSEAQVSNYVTQTQQKNLQKPRVVVTENDEDDMDMVSGLLKPQMQDQDYEYEDAFEIQDNKQLPEGPIIKKLNDDLLMSKSKPATTQLPAEVHRDHGTIHYANGCYYTGEFVNNKREGKGIFFDQTGRILVEGTFQNDKPQGFVKMQNYPETEVKNNYGHFDLKHINNPWILYEGFVIDGRKQGPGTLTFQNKDKFVGKFKGDSATGQGEYIYYNGIVIKGLWQHNKFTEYIKNE